MSVEGALVCAGAPPPACRRCAAPPDPHRINHSGSDTLHWLALCSNTFNILYLLISPMCRSTTCSALFHCMCCHVLMQHASQVALADAALAGAAAERAVNTSLTGQRVCQNSADRANTAPSPVWSRSTLLQAASRRRAVRHRQSLASRLACARAPLRTGCPGSTMGKGLTGRRRLAGSRSTRRARISRRAREPATWGRAALF